MVSKGRPAHPPPVARRGGSGPALRLVPALRYTHSQMATGFPTITAHTGCEDTAENTVASALAGLSLGADAVEVDVRADAQGRLYLWHDDEVHTTDSGSLAVSELRLRDLLELERCGRIRFDHPQGRITTLHDLLGALANLPGRVNLDLKDDRSASLAGEAVNRAGFADRVLASGCSMPRARLFRRLNTLLPVFLNSDFGSARTPVSPARAEQESAAAADAGCCGLNIHHRLCSPVVVEAARKRSLLVSVWTVGARDGFERYIAMGVDNITTRDVRALVEVRERMRSR